MARQPRGFPLLTLMTAEGYLEPLSIYRNKMKGK